MNPFKLLSKINFIKSNILSLLIVFFFTNFIFSLNAKDLNNTTDNLFPVDENTKSGRFIGTMNNIVIFIRFADQEEFTESFQFCEDFMNSTTNPSVKTYYAENSGNNLIIQSHFFPEPDTENDQIISYQDSHPIDYYRPYDAVTNPIGYESAGYEREDQLLKDAVRALKTEIESKNLDLDINSDGIIDNISFILNRPEGGAFSTYLYPTLIQLNGGGDDVFINGKKAYNGNKHTTQYLQQKQLGFFCHEMFHGFSGAPDIYNSSSIADSPVGVWDLMSQVSFTQPHLLVYMKMKYGTWIESIPQITEPGTYTLEAIKDNPFAAYEIPSPNSSTEKFIVEYRKPGGIFEIGLDKDNIEHGLIIYRVDSRYNGCGGGEPYFEVYVFRPLYGTHPEEGNSNLAGFAIENNRTLFNSETNPSCFLNDGSDGGIFIANVTSNQNNTISFDVIDPNNIVAPTALFTSDIQSGEFPLKVSFSESSTDFPTSFSWDFGDGSTSTERHPNHTYQSPGLYTVTLSVSNSKGTNTITKADYIQVDKKDQTINFTEPSEATVGETIVLNATTTSNLEIDYAVVSGDATLASDGKTITFDAAGNVEIKAQQDGNSEYNAAPEQLLTVSVSESTGINTISNCISIYPNPLKNNLNIKADKLYKIKLIDILGNVMLQYTMQNNISTIDLSALNNGQYIIQLIENNRIIHYQKIIKQ